MAVRKYDRYCDGLGEDVYDGNYYGEKLLRRDYGY